MSKKQKKEEQLDLIDVHPKNAKLILEAAKTYKKAQIMRQKALDKEVQEKQKVLSLVKEAELQRLADGSITFRLDNTIITIKPRDELVKVKCEDEE